MGVRLVCLLVAALAALVLPVSLRDIVAETPEPLATATSTPAATPTVEAAPARIRIEHQCAPSVMRPGEWTAVECITRYINESDQAGPAGRVLIVPATTGPVVETFFIQVRRDGELLPVGTSPTSFEAEGLAPKQTVETRATLLMNIQTEGESRSELRLVSREGQVAASTPLVFVGDEQAADPPKELSASRRFMVVQGPEGGHRALYVVTVTNASTHGVTALTITARHDGPAALIEADPAASSQNALAGLTTWDLSSFGKDSLAPGESLTLRAAYGLSEEPGCGSVTAAAVVKATVGGQEKSYAVGPMNSGWFGECRPPEPPPTPVDGGDGAGGPPEGTGRPPIVLPATGQALKAGGGAWQREAAAALAVAGLLALTAASAVRSRMRHL